MPKRQSDYVYHPPVGSSYPGKEDANPYIQYPPDEIRRLMDTEEDPSEYDKMKSALKQWERIYVYPWYPWRAVRALRKIARQMLAADQPVNVPYYHENDIGPGVDNVLNILKPTDDNDDMKRFDYNRQGERPVRDDLSGDFTSPSEPVMNNGRGTVSPDGEGPDAEIYYPFPPTGGNLGAI